MKTILTILSLVALFGCSSTPIERTNTVTVKVPVTVPIPEPKQVQRPDLMIYHLTPTDQKDPGKVAQYYMATIKQLQGYSIELETILDGYRNINKAPPK